MKRIVESLNRYTGPVPIYAVRQNQHSLIIPEQPEPVAAKAWRAPEYSHLIRRRAEPIEMPRADRSITSMARTGPRPNSREIPQGSRSAIATSCLGR